MGKLKWIVAVVIIASLGWFVYTSDLAAIRDNILTVGFDFFWILLVTLFAQFFGTLSWKLTLPRQVKISLKDLFLIRFVGDQIGLINPANFVGGDAFKAYQLEKYKISFSDSISSLVVARGIMIYVQVVVFLLSAVVYLFIAEVERMLLFQLILLSLTFLVLVALLATKSGRLFKLKWFRADKLQKKINEVRTSISDYYHSDKKRFYMANFWGAINFVIGALEIWLICRFINVDITYLEALLIDQGVLFLKSFGAFVPGQVGVEEYINKVMLGIVGITSTSIWLSVSIFRRARQLFWLILCLPVYYLFMKPVQTKLALEVE